MDDTIRSNALKLEVDKERPFEPTLVLVMAAQKPVYAEVVKTFNELQQRMLAEIANTKPGHGFFINLSAFKCEITHL